jgi:predicted ABC-type ATPase
MADEDLPGSLYPDLSPADREEVLANLDRYFEIVLQIFLRKRSRLAKEGRSFVYQDTTIDSQLIREAHEAGFEVKVFYVGTEDPNLNMGRVLLRVSNGGPFAALARIADDYAHGLKHLPEAKKLADDLMLFDNITHGRGPRLVDHFRAGETHEARPLCSEVAPKSLRKGVRTVVGFTCAQSDKPSVRRVNVTADLSRRVRWCLPVCSSTARLSCSTIYARFPEDSELSLLDVALDRGLGSDLR